MEANMAGSCVRSARALAAATWLGAGAAAPAQFITDGTLDAQPIGTAPDCGTAAGAWYFPANYITSLLCETLPEHIEVVPTSLFDPGAPGRSLGVNISDPNPNLNI